MGLKPGDVVVLKTSAELSEIYPYMDVRFADIAKDLQGVKFTVVKVAPEREGRPDVVFFTRPGYLMSCHLDNYPMTEKDFAPAVSRYPTNMRGSCAARR